MLVVSRFRVAGDGGSEDGGSEDGGSEGGAVEAFRRDVRTAVAALSAQAGYVDGECGRNLDDPELWVLVTRWADVGSYRRALSSYDVRVAAVPLLARAIDEPSAYEPDTGELNRNIPR